MASSELCIQDNGDETYRSTLTIIDGGSRQVFEVASTPNGASLSWDETFSGIRVQVTASDQTTTAIFTTTISDVVVTSIQSVTTAPCPTA